MMRRIIRLLLIFVLLVSPTLLLSQENNCKVLLSGIANEYWGKCRKGMAHGKGIAKGEDRYEGRFSAGLPHGYGTYIWANGDVYEGRWRNGKRHGNGIFKSIVDGQPTTQEGIWSRDQYVGKIRVSPYVVGNSANLIKYSVNRLDNGNRILTTFYVNNRITGPSSDLLFNIDSGSSIQIGQSYGYENVTFPAKINITYTHDSILRVQFEVVINEPGSWEIRLYN